MRVPAFSGANEQHAVSRVFDHVAAIVKMKSKFEAGRRSFRKDDVHKVVAASAELLQAHALILKEGQRFTVLTRHSVDGQGARKLKHQDALFACFGANLDGGSGVQSIVGKNGSLQGIVQGMEGRGANRVFRCDVRRPNVEKSPSRGLVHLAKKKLFCALRIQDDVKRAR